MEIENSLGRHVRRTLVLAWPMVLSRVGLISMFTVDVVVLGRAGAGPLSEYVLGQAVIDSLVAMVIGLLIGVPVLVARETGAGRDAAAGTIWRRGLITAASLGLALCALLQFAPSFLRATGQTAELAESAGLVARILGASLPGLALFYVSAAFLEALHRPLPAMLAIGLGNLVNLALNILLVFDAGPLPALGAPGCALASVITFALLAIGMGCYVRFVLPGRQRYGIGVPAAGTSDGLHQLRLGLAAGGSHLFEASSFTVMTLFIGWIGIIALAAHGVLFQILAITFMVAFGIAGATQVRVGNAWGRGDARGIAMAGWTGLALAALLTALAGLAVAVAPRATLGLFTSDEAVVAAALPVLSWVLLALVFDGGQTVMSNACRGRGDAWMPTALHFCSYWLVMVPAAWVFAFGLDQGLAGIYQAIILASVVSLMVMSARFAWLAGRTIDAPPDLPPGPPPARAGR